MNFRLTLILVAVLAVIVGLFAFLHSRPEPSKTEESRANAIFTPAPKEISAITFQRGNEVQVAFARPAKDNWNLTAPTTAPANGWQVDSIASTLKDLSYKDKFAPEPSGAKSLDYVGLKNPLYTIRFKDADGTEHTLRVGKRNAAGNYYASVDQNPDIYLLSQNPVESLDKPADEFRNKKLSTLDTDKVTALKVTRQGQTTELVKSGGKWVIQRPIPARADETLISDMLYQLRNLSATQFTSVRKDKAAGFAPPRLIVEALGTPDTQPATQATATSATSTSAPASQPAQTLLTVEFGNTVNPMLNDGVYATLAGSSEVYELGMDPFNKLNKGLHDLIDHAVVNAAVTNAEDLSFTSTTPSPTVPAKMDLHKQGNDWKVNDLPADAADVQSLLTALKDLRANKVVTGAGDLKALGLEPPTRTLSIAVPNNPQREVLLIGKPDSAEPLTPVMRQGESTVYLVQNPEMARISPTLLTLRSREVEKFTADNIHAITVKEAAGKTVTLTREGKGWKVQAGSEKPADADAGKITTLLGELTPLTADKWLDTRVPPGLKDQLTVTLSIAPRTAAALGPAPATTTSAPATTAATGTAPAETGPRYTRVLHLARYTPPTSAPATVPATTSSQPATNAGTGPATTRAAETWAAWLDAPSAWLFAPSPELIQHLTQASYAAPAKPTTATSPSTTASAPAK